MSERLESVGWGTTYDPEDEIIDNNYEDYLIVFIEERMFGLYCYHFKTPVNLNTVTSILQASEYLKEGDDLNSLEHRFIASSTGFEEDALELVNSHADFSCISNEDIEVVLEGML